MWRLKDKMTNLDMLLIRACKSKNPKVRLASLYRRFYGSYTEKEQILTTLYLLIEIIEKYGITSLDKFVSDLLRNITDQDLLNNLLGTAIYFIRFSPTKMYLELKPPKMFRE